MSFVVLGQEEYQKELDKAVYAVHNVSVGPVFSQFDDDRQDLQKLANLLEDAKKDPAKGSEARMFFDGLDTMVRDGVPMHVVQLIEKFPYQ
jgi:hypothetical protein